LAVIGILFLGLFLAFSYIDSIYVVVYGIIIIIML